MKLGRVADRPQKSFRPAAARRFHSPSIAFHASLSTTPHFFHCNKLLRPATHIFTSTPRNTQTSPIADTTPSCHSPSCLPSSQKVRCLSPAAPSIPSSLANQLFPVTWAQRSSSSEADKNYVYLTIVAADVPESDLKLDLKEQSLSFKGPSTSKKVTYAIDLEFFAEIDPKESKISHSGRDISLVLRKKDLKDEYWPRLLKDNKKMHFLKTDFDKVSVRATLRQRHFLSPVADTHAVGGRG